MKTTSQILKDRAIENAVVAGVKQGSFSMEISGHGEVACGVFLAHRPEGKTLWRVSYYLNGSRVSGAKLDALV